MLRYIKGGANFSAKIKNEKIVDKLCLIVYNELNLVIINIKVYGKFFE